MRAEPNRVIFGTMMKTNYWHDTDSSTKVKCTDRRNRQEKPALEVYESKYVTLKKDLRDCVVVLSKRDRGEITTSEFYKKS